MEYEIGVRFDAVLNKLAEMETRQIEMDKKIDKILEAATIEEPEEPTKKKK